MKKTYFLPIVTILLSFASYAQDSDFDQFLVASENDARLLLSNYSEPVFTALGYGFANSWYNTAETHKPLGFDITISANAVMWPTTAETFNPNTIGLTSVSNLPSRLETLVGPGDINESMTISYQGTDPSGVNYRVQEDITAPQGFAGELPFKALPVPMAQVGIGTFKNTDLKLRFTPSITQDDLEIQMYGAGLMHDITQWIPGLKLTPVHISALIGYSRINAIYDLNGVGLNGSDQFAEFSIDSWTYQLLVSKNLSIFTFYGAIGGNSGTSNFDMLGRYEYEATNIDNGQPFTRVLNDPLTISSSVNSFRATAGFRIKLAVITIHADYTLQEYDIISAGIGLTVR